MSTLASLDITLSRRGTGTLSVDDMLQSIIARGWNPINNGKTLYLPLGDDDDFDWKTGQLSISELLNLAALKEQNSEIIGVAMTWQNTLIGGTLLIHPNQTISFSFTINRKRLTDKITDVNWYLERILPCFETEIMTVEKFTFTQD